MKKIGIVAGPERLGNTWCSIVWIEGTLSRAFAGRATSPSLIASKGASAFLPAPPTTVRLSDKRSKALMACLLCWLPGRVDKYASGTAQAVLDHAEPDARLIFSFGWHITRDGLDVSSWRTWAVVSTFCRVARLLRFGALGDQVEACRRVFASQTRWTVVCGSALDEGPSEGLLVWSKHVGDPILVSNLTRRVNFALFLVAALADDALVQKAPAIVGCRLPSVLQAVLQARMV